MIISKTPFRISFFGGGTDYPKWFVKEGGEVLSTTFDKYCYVTSRFLPPFFEHNYKISYSMVETVKNVNHIKHPVVKAVLKEFKFNKGLEIHINSDLPARSGLGSSSSFTVGLLNSLYSLKKIFVPKNFIAKEAIRIEQDVLKENVGSQDQIAAAYGGFNIIYFKKKKNFIVEPIKISVERKNLLNNHLMLFFTGFSRIASTIAKNQIENIKNNREQLLKMRSMVEDAKNILLSKKNICEFGDMLNIAWNLKKSLSNQISNCEIDSIYNLALKSGAIGGKLLGAGGGGFMLLFVEPDKQEKVKKVLKEFIHVPFKFEKNGSQIIN
jgi:D-glycero-alpha-D-manno-heptose-7-phosphate kinase